MKRAGGQSTTHIKDMPCRGVFTRTTNLILRTLSGHQVAEIKKQAGACRAGVIGNFCSEHGDQRLKEMGSRRGYLNVKRYI